MAIKERTIGADFGWPRSEGAACSPELHHDWGHDHPSEPGRTESAKVWLTPGLFPLAFVVP